MNIVNCVILNIIDLKFEKINPIQENLNSKLDLGGCIRTINIFQRKIDQILILNTYSDSTTAGIKIIDDPFLLTSFLKKFNFSQKIEAQVQFKIIKILIKKRLKSQILSLKIIMFFAMATILKQHVQFISTRILYVSLIILIFE